MPANPPEVAALTEEGGSSALCVLFDLDGTLYNSPTYSQRLEVEIAKFVSEKISMDIEHASAILRDRRREVGTLTKALESLGIERDEFFDSIAARVEPGEFLSKDDSVNTMLISLKQEGFKVGLVSNSGRRLVEKILVALQLDPAVFSAIITSSDVRPKPSAEPYLLALRLMHCKRENSVYVGDRDEAELHPAKELGIRTVLIDRVGDAPSRWADVTVSDLSEIPKALRRIFPT